MHILLTNDDGIRAPGLRALADGLIADGHRVTVSAPDRERSATSHSVLLGVPVKAEPVEFPGAQRAWAVGSTPADCASLGLWLTREDPVDMVLAGINYGMNQGGACIYSGTVGAAMEAAMCGCQAVAVSLCIRKRGDAVDFAPAARLAARVVRWAAGHPLPQGCIYNLNVPPLPYDEILGLRAARMAPVFLGAPNYEACPEGFQYTHNTPVPMEDPLYDVNLTGRGYATLTKLTWDLRLPEPDDELNEIGL